MIYGDFYHCVRHTPVKTDRFCVVNAVDSLEVINLCVEIQNVLFKR